MGSTKLDNWKYLPVPCERRDTSPRERSQVSSSVPLPRYIPTLSDWGHSRLGINDLVLEYVREEQDVCKTQRPSVALGMKISLKSHFLFTVLPSTSTWVATEH